MAPNGSDVLVVMVRGGVDPSAEPSTTKNYNGAACVQYLQGSILFGATYHLHAYEYA